MWRISFGIVQPTKQNHRHLRRHNNYIQRQNRGQKICEPHLKSYIQVPTPVMAIFGNERDQIPKHHCSQDTVATFEMNHMQYMEPSLDILFDFVNAKKIHGKEYGTREAEDAT